MKCIYCGAGTRITNSRKSKKLTQTWRRHTCTTCHRNFTTYEYVDLASSHVVSTENGTFPFSRPKLFISIYRALDHRVSSERDSEELTGQICGELLKDANTELTTTQIRHVALQTLNHFDAAGAIKYQVAHEQLPQMRDVQRTLKQR